MLRGLYNPNKAWAQLFFRKTKLFTLRDKPKWVNLPLITIWASKYGIKSKGSPLSYAIWNSWGKHKESLAVSNNLRKTIGSHKWDSIWWLALSNQPIEEHEESKALQLHKKRFRCWFDLWKHTNDGWKSRADLIANFNLSNRQLNIITTWRIGTWHKGDLWLLTCHQYPKIETFVWKD